MEASGSCGMGDWRVATIGKAGGPYGRLRSYGGAGTSGRQVETTAWLCTRLIGVGKQGLGVWGTLLV